MSATHKITLPGRRIYNSITFAGAVYWLPMDAQKLANDTGGVVTIGKKKYRPNRPPSG